MTFSYVLFCLTNSPKPKDIESIIIGDNGKQRILTFYIKFNDKGKVEFKKCLQICWKGKMEILHWHMYPGPLLWNTDNISQPIKFNSGASHFSWSSLRRFYTLTGANLWYIQLIGHDLERHQPVYIRSHSWQCISEQKPSHEVKGTASGAHRQDRVEAQIWERLQKQILLHWRFPRAQWPL